MDNLIDLPTGLKNVNSVIRENSLKRGNDFPFSGIWIFSGAQGSGKTLTLFHFVREIMSLYPDCLIISNISIFGVPCIPYKGIEDFALYNNGSKGIIFIIDEIHTLFNSLESAKLPLSTVQVWSQNRKNRRLILGTSQRFNRISKPIREQTTWNFFCVRPLFNLIYSYTVYDGSLYDDSGRYIGEDPKRHFYIPSVNVMRMYNTLEVVSRE